MERTQIHFPHCLWIKEDRYEEETYTAKIWEMLEWKKKQL